MMTLLTALLLWVRLFLVFVDADCVPDVPERLLSDPMILRHPAVIAAFEDVERNLSALFESGSRDALSFAIVHASSPESVFSFNHGLLKHNESYPGNNITSDSIMRIASISKHFATMSVFVAQNEGISLNKTPELSLDTPVRLLLPEFGLPERDWEDGGRDITLGMLASHTGGVPREGYTTNFNMVTGQGKADADTIGGAWSRATPESVLEFVKRTNLMFAPGQRAACAATAYYNSLHAENLTWNEFVAQKILTPLNMTHTFAGPIPPSLLPSISIPASPHWADLLVGQGYDPAAGMWSSANDLTKYLHHLWLTPNPNPLLTRPQRRHNLHPTTSLPDGKQQVGAGWELDLLQTRTSSSPHALHKTYATYGKAGDAGGWHAWIDVVPNLGYGIVVLAQEARVQSFARVVPTAVHDAVHSLLVRGFAEALGDALGRRWAGWYSDGRDGGVVGDVLEGGSSGASYARVEVEEQVLYLRELVVNGTSALEGVDRLGWGAGEGEGARVWSTERGVVLTAAEGAGERAEFGEGSQVWRMMVPGLEKCDWWDFDGYTDHNGWPLSKVVFVEKGGSVELRYPPYDIVLSRMETHKRL